MLPFIWSNLHKNQVHKVITTAMPTMLTDSGAQRWIWWKPINLLSKWLHINVMPKVMVHISAVIEEVVENPFTPSTHRHMVQDLNIGSIQIRNSMLALTSLNNKKILKKSFWHSHKAQIKFLSQLLTKIALKDISKLWKNHFKMAWLLQLQTGEAHKLIWSG